MKTKRPAPRKLPSGSWNCVVTVKGQRISVTDEDCGMCQARAMAIQAGVIEKQDKPKDTNGLFHLKTKSNIRYNNTDAINTTLT